MQRNAEFGVGVQNFRAHFLQALQLFLLLRRRIIRKRLIADRRILYVRPRWFGVLLLQSRPIAISLEPPFCHEFPPPLLHPYGSPDLSIQTLLQPASLTTPT